MKYLLIDFWQSDRLTVYNSIKINLTVEKEFITYVWGHGNSVGPEVGVVNLVVVVFVVVVEVVVLVVDVANVVVVDVAVVDVKVVAGAVVEDAVVLIVVVVDGVDIIVFNTAGFVVINTFVEVDLSNGTVVVLV